MEYAHVVLRIAAAPLVLAADCAKSPAHAPHEPGTETPVVLSPFSSSMVGDGELTRDEISDRGCP